MFESYRWSNKDLKQPLLSHLTHIREYFKAFSREKFLALWFGVLLFISPFNITKRLLWLIEDGDQYVNGRYINYLVPFISLLDLAILVWVIACGTRQLKLVQRSLIFLVWAILVLNLAINDNSSQLISTARLGLYFTFAIQLINNFDIVARLKKLLIPIIITALLLQVSIATMQIAGGSSIGLQALGESKIYAGNGAASIVSPSGSWILRGYGTFPHPNVLGAWIITMSLLLAALSSKKYFSFLSTLSIVTFSKTAFGISILISALTIATIFPATFKNFTLAGFSLNINSITESNSFRERVELNQRAIAMIKNNPISGVGVGNFSKELATLPPIHAENGLILYQPVHNIYLLLLSEFGVIFGLTIIFIMVFGIGRTIEQKINSDKFDILTFFCLVTILGFSLSDHFSQTLPQGLFIFCTLSVLIKYNTEELSTISKP